MSSKDVVSIVKATSNGSRIAVIEMPANKVAICVLGCLAEEWTENNELYLTEDAAFTLLSVLESWKLSRGLEERTL